jgi:hypothetical protein
MYTMAGHCRADVLRIAFKVLSMHPSPCLFSTTRTSDTRYRLPLTKRFVFKGCAPEVKYCLHLEIIIYMESLGRSVVCLRDAHQR